MTVTPIKALLAKRKITAAELGRAVRQRGHRRAGKPLSAAAVSDLINHGKFPRSTPEEEVKQQIEKFLTDRGVPPAELKGLWTAAATAAQSDEPRPNARPQSTPAQEDTMLTEAKPLTAQAKRHFKLARDPFQDDINEPEDVYLGPAQYDALEAFNEAAQYGRFCAVIGESGSGKSTLRELFEERHRGQKVQIIRPYVTDMADSKDEGQVLKSSQIHEAIIRKLAPAIKVPGKPQAKQETSYRLLCESANAGYRNVLVIEEAHDLPTPTLKHLKRFHELKDGLRRVFGILLIGQTELAERLTVRMSWATREVAQRCAVTMLTPLEPDELAAYVAFKFSRAGVEAGAIFEPDAYPALAQALTRQQTNGRGLGAVEINECYPLAIGNLVVRVLNISARSGFAKIGEAEVAAAMAAREA